MKISYRGPLSCTNLEPIRHSGVRPVSLYRTPPFSTIKTRASLVSVSSTTPNSIRAGTSIKFRHHKPIITASTSQIQIRIQSTMSLSRSIDPLVWIDCEMTGLDSNKDTILSISCYITDHLLEPIEPKGYHAIISTPSSVLSTMSEWCVQTHTATGLVAACQSSSAMSASQAAKELLSYIQQHITEPRVALLAGNSVHADKMFLMKEPWTPVLHWLHYRILDVSAIKEAVRRWGDDGILEGVPKKKLCHSADEDIKESLEEARYYMGLIQGLGRSSG